MALCASFERDSRLRGNDDIKEFAYGKTATNAEGFIKLNALQLRLLGTGGEFHLW